MKKTLLVFVVLILIIGVVGLWFVYKNISQNNPSNESNKPQIAVTIFPIYDIAKNIAGDKIDVELILPAGASPHTFNFSPKDVKRLQKIKMIFAVGFGLDDWVTKLSENISTSETIFVFGGLNLRELGADQHSHDHDHVDYDTPQDFTIIPSENSDPHYWLSIHNAKAVASNIYNELSKLYPKNREYFEENLLKYTDELNLIIPTKVSDKKISIVTMHDAWFYFAEENDLDIVGTFEPFAGEEPTPKYLKNLSDTIKEHNVKIIAVEPQIGLDSLKPIAEDFGLEIIELDPIGGAENRDSYIDMMKFNFVQLEKIRQIMAQ